MKSTILLAIASVAALNAQIPVVRWLPSNHTDAQQGVLTGRGIERVCRGDVGGTLYSGTLGGHGCVVRVGGNDIFLSSHQVAVGLSTWDGPNPSATPVTSGAYQQHNLEVCRARGTNGWVVGSRLTPNTTCEVPGVGTVSAPNYETLYASRLNELHQIVSTTSSLCVGIRTAPRAETSRCTNVAPLQWAVVQDISGNFRFASPSNPALCLNLPSGTQARLDACGPDSFFKLQPITDSSYRLVNLNGLALTLAAATGEGVALSAQAPDNTRLTQQSFEVLSTSDNARKLTVLSYNMMMLFGGYFPGMVAQSRAENIVEAIRRENTGADIVAIQEAFDPSAFGALKDRLRGLGFTYFSERPYDFWNAGKGLSSGGVFVASRWPIEAMDNFTFANGAGADGAASKGVSYALINKMGRRYHVFTTHLQAGNEPIIRFTQLIEMASFIRGKVGQNPAGDPVIMAGDYNIDMEAAPGEYEAMLATLGAVFHNAPRPVGAFVPQPGQPRWTVNDQTNLIARNRGAHQEWLDYVLVSRTVLPTQASYRVIEFEHSNYYLMSVEPAYKLPNFQIYKDLSDHSALLAKFRF